jgi:outer membrane receptor for ferrienterochelin and colicins
LDLKYERTLKEDIEVTARVYYDRVTYHGVYVDSPQGQNGDQLNEDFGRGDWMGTMLYATKPVFQKHKLTGGLDVRDNLQQNQLDYNINPYAAVLHDERESTNWALFAQDDFSITKSLILNAGVRHDHYQSFGGTTNPRLALIYSPLSRTTLKLLYGQAFRAPNNYELFYYDGVSQEANPRLRPETITTSELVWEQELSSKIRLTADGFDNFIRSLISEQTDLKNGLLVFENSQKARSRGVEFEVAGRNVRGIEGRVSYSFQTTLDSTTGIALTNSPQHLAKAEIIWPFAHRRLFLGTDLQYMSARTTLAGTAVEPHEITNLTLSSREFAGGFRVSASAYNLFNRIYSDPVGPEIRSTFVQQNGRDFRINLTRTFHFK